MILQIDLWKWGIEGAKSVTSTGELIAGGIAWSIIVTLILFFKYKIHPVIAIPLAPVIVIVGFSLFVGGFIIVLEVLIALLVPALVLFFLFGLLPISVGYSDEE
ncbi:hypothetical protein [Halorubrum sp. C191]|uniref:hypothetical protein n=1 Tax=Halorubrum sp. C191 TaxID=1383842 RepID=UPI001181833D|nr:hypothetical protein [Halorubrum sp. C191]